MHTAHSIQKEPDREVINKERKLTTMLKVCTRVYYTCMQHKAAYHSI